MLDPGTGSQGAGAAEPEQTGITINLNGPIFICSPGQLSGMSAAIGANSQSAVSAAGSAVADAAPVWLASLIEQAQLVQGARAVPRAVAPVVHLGRKQQQGDQQGLQQQQQQGEQQGEQQGQQQGEQQDAQQQLQEPPPSKRKAGFDPGSNDVAPPSATRSGKKRRRNRTAPATQPGDAHAPAMRAGNGAAAPAAAAAAPAGVAEPVIPTVQVVAAPDDVALVGGLEEAVSVQAAAAAAAAAAAKPAAAHASPPRGTILAEGPEPSTPAHGAAPGVANIAIVPPPPPPPRQQQVLQPPALPGGAGVPGLSQEQLHMLWLEFVKQLNGSCAVTMQQQQKEEEEEEELAKQPSLSTPAAGDVPQRGVIASNNEGTLQDDVPSADGKRAWSMAEMAEAALRQLPGRRGTSSDVARSISSMPEFVPHLDCTLVPVPGKGTTTARWKLQLNSVLKSDPSRFHPQLAEVDDIVRHVYMLATKRGGSSGSGSVGGSSARQGQGGEEARNAPAAALTAAAASGGSGDRSCGVLSDAASDGSTTSASTSSSSGGSGVGEDDDNTDVSFGNTAAAAAAATAGAAPLEVLPDPGTYEVRRDTSRARSPWTDHERRRLTQLVGHYRPVYGNDDWARLWEVIADLLGRWSPSGTAVRNVFNSIRKGAHREAVLTAAVAAAAGGGGGACGGSSSGPSSTAADPGDAAALLLGTSTCPGAHGDGGAGGATTTAGAAGTAGVTSPAAAAAAAAAAFPDINTYAMRRDAQLMKSLWSEEERGHLVRLVAHYRPQDRGDNHTWEVIADQLGRWTEGGKAVRTVFNQLQRDPNFRIGDRAAAAARNMASMARYALEHLPDCEGSYAQVSAFIAAEPKFQDKLNWTVNRESNAIKPCNLPRWKKNLSGVLKSGALFSKRRAAQAGTWVTLYGLHAQEEEGGEEGGGGEGQQSAGGEGGRTAAGAGRAAFGSVLTEESLSEASLAVQQQQQQAGGNATASDANVDAAKDGTARAEVKQEDASGASQVGPGGIAMLQGQQQQQQIAIAPASAGGQLIAGTKLARGDLPRLAVRAMWQLPGKCGTVAEVSDVIEAKFGNLVDSSVREKDGRTPRWRAALSKCMMGSSYFRLKHRGVHHVYALNCELVTKVFGPGLGE